MKCLRFSLILSIAFLLTGGLQAAVTRLTDLSRLTEAAVFLRFGDNETRLAGSGNDLGRLFGRWGVEMQSPAGNTLLLESFPQPPPPNPLPPGFPYYKIVNLPSSEESDGPLVFNFSRPVRRVVFTLLENDDDGTFTAYTPEGDLLGSVAGETSAPFTGLETDDPRGIGKVVVAYPSSVAAEQVSSVAFEYTQGNMAFTALLPQLGFGESGGLRLDTEISLLNLSNTPVRGQVDFFDDDGSPLQVDAEGSSRSFALAPFDSLSFTLEGAARVLTQGYGRVRSEGPLEATAVYTTRDSQGNLLAEAGVGSAVAQFVLNAFLERVQETGLDTGLALLNDSDVVTIVEIQWSGAPGPFHTVQRLQPGQHAAFFMDQLFPQLAGQDFRGNLLLRSDRPVAAALLRTRGGVASASVPLGGLLQQTIR